MIILAIDTSCDETAAAVVENQKVVSNIIWSQASQHANFGGVVPSLAKRMHEERIDWVIKKALGKKYQKLRGIDAIAVTTGPGLSIALGVGVDKAKALAIKHQKPLIAVNHIKAHLLSPLVNSNENLKFPAIALCLSGGNTTLVLIKSVGNYKVLAQTADDALGEALDKAARMLNLGYPGGAILEKFARLGKENSYPLPLPLENDKVKNRFSYSGLKTAFSRLLVGIKNLQKNDIYNLAASYQNVAFKHVEGVLEYHLKNQGVKIKSLLLGGGVAANTELRKRIRKIGKKYGLKLLLPYSSKLCGDNAAMIGVCAYLVPKSVSPTKIDRDPRLSI